MRALSGKPDDVTYAKPGLLLFIGVDLRNIEKSGDTPS
jgi:hypothetical protein